MMDMRNFLSRFTLHLTFDLSLTLNNKTKILLFCQNKCCVIIVHIFSLLVIICNGFLNTSILIFHKHYHYNNY